MLDSSNELAELGNQPRNKNNSADQLRGFNTGRWTPDEHFRFIEALKIHGKEWRKVQQHVYSRTSTQARSHAQKFFVKLEKNNITLIDFMDTVDIDGLRRLLKSDCLKDEDAIDDLLLRNKLNEEVKSPQSSSKKPRKANIMNMVF